MAENGITTEVAAIPIRTIGDLIDVSIALEPHKGNIPWYRGHRSAKWHVEPTIWRGEFEPHDERNFAHRFRSRAAIRVSDAPAYHAVAHWISLMRHYGLPTRLMDWSRSPLVALYFALQYLFENVVAQPEDSVIWVLLPHRLNELEKIDKVGALTPSISSETCFPLLAGAFYEVTEPCKVLAVMAHDVDMRIFVQQGCFTVHSSRIALNKRERHSEFLFPLLIPAENARGLADQLFAAGLRKGDIYPDLPNLAAEIVETHRFVLSRRSRSAAR
jgi:hypothetical protein